MAEKIEKSGKTVKRYVWEFTNQRKLTKKEFLSYFEKKVFRTIRTNEMLPKANASTRKNFNSMDHSKQNRGTSEASKITLKKSNDLNTQVLKQVLETKFKTTFSNKPNFSSENASDIAELTLQNILKGKFTAPSPIDKTNKPLYYLNDIEVELYANLKDIKGTKKKRDPKIQELTGKFIEKNQDLEINILKAIKQINDRN